MHENIDKLMDQFAASLADGTFIKLSLSNYKGSEERLQKLLLRLVETKKGSRLFVQYRFETRDIVRNYSFEDGVGLVRGQLEAGFRSAHLFTLEHDYQLTIGKRSSRLNVGKPSIRKKPPTEHDRRKHTYIDADSYYLHLLGITSAEGQILAAQQDKWKQINKFVEVLAGLYERSELAGRTSLSIVDMGSGKGYLTFAAYDYFANVKSLTVSITGVEVRKEQVDFCNQVAAAGGMDGLRFIEGAISDASPESVDMLIALHACDTATDDAIFKGVTAGASIVVAAPCCHKELRAQFRVPKQLEGMLKHAVMTDRTAEMVTDSIRSLVLEKHGFSTRMFEFVSTEHTPKNNLIVGVRGSSNAAVETASAQLAELKEFFGITSQKLDSLLA